jgi:hypothetical protein
VTKYEESPDAGYECDDNSGVGRSNPAHTGCGDGELGVYVNTVTVTVIAELDDGTLVTIVESDRSGYQEVSTAP